MTNTQKKPNLMWRTCIAAGLMFLITSCAERPSEILVAEAKSEPEILVKKPVKIPIGTVEKGKYTGIAMDDFFALQQTGDVLIYDVRVPYFYNIDHIPGSINWPHTQYEEQIQQRDLEIQKAKKEGKSVVLYCFNLGCPEARNVAKKLTRRGYNLKVFSSGIDTWRAAELPLE